MYSPYKFQKKFLNSLIILQVGFFKTSRTIKGKRAPPACKEVESFQA